MWDKIGIILWKNYIYNKNHWIYTLFQIFTPFIFFIVFVECTKKYNNLTKKLVNVTYSEVLSVEDIYRKINFHDTKLLFAPNTKFIDDLTERARLKIEMLSDGNNNAKYILWFFYLNTISYAHIYRYERIRK